MLQEEKQSTLPLEENEFEEHMMGVIMTCFGLKAGLKWIPKKKEAAIAAELGKLHNIQPFIQIYESKMSEEEKEQAVKSLILLKENCDQTILGQMVADWTKQWETAVKGKATLPIANSEYQINLHCGHGERVQGEECSNSWSTNHLPPCRDE